MTIQQASPSVVRPPADQGRPALRDPHTAARARVERRPGSDRDLRLLFVGTGLDHGWNAAKDRAAPAGDIERGLRAITGLPCEIDVIGDESADAAAVVKDLAARGPRIYDAAVVALGARNAMRLTPVAAWGARLVELVDALQAALPDGAPVLLIGTPTVHVPKRVQPLNPIALRHAARLDRVARRLAEIRTSVRYVQAPSLTNLVGRRPGGDLTAGFSLPIASAVAGALREPPASALRPGTVDRPDLHLLVGVARTDGLAVLEGLVRRAAAEFHVAEAAISLFDGERRWRIASTGRGAVDPGRSLAYCETVVCTSEVVVVEHSEGDALAAQRRIAAPVPAFYAGAPVHAADGSAVGAMCLLEGVPRSADSVDLDRLREFAHEAGLAVRTVAAATAGPWTLG